MKTRFTEVIKLIDAQPCNLVYHQERVNKTALHFYGRKIDLSELVGKILPRAKSGLYKLRLVYADTIETVECIPYSPKSISSIAIVCHDTIAYDFKYENRQLINELRAKSGHDEMIIVKNGMITDSSIHNLIFESADGLYTPNSCLLRGTKRQFLLDQGIIREKRIPLNDIQQYTTLHFINAMIDLEDKVSIPIDSLYSSSATTSEVFRKAGEVLSQITCDYPKYNT